MTINKIIHNIWVGPKKVPDGVFKWKEINPDCEHILWDEKKIEEEFPGIFSNNIFAKHFYESKVFNGVSDILRYYILYRFGGIYFDADCIPLRKLEDYIFDDDFFSVYENEVRSPGLVASGVMGAKEKSEIIKYIIKNLNNRDLSQDAWISVGPKCLTDALQKFSKNYKIYPSYYFLPTHHTGLKYNGDFSPYCSHFWGTTKGAYN